MKSHRLWAIAFVVMLVFGLAACRIPGAAPVVEPTEESLATGIEDVVGDWEGEFTGNRIHLKISTDGTYLFVLPDYLESGDEASHSGSTGDDPSERGAGSFWFEEKQILFESDLSRSYMCQIIGPGSYEVYVTKQGSKRTQLRFNRVNDRCADRRNFLSKPFALIEP